MTEPNFDPSRLRYIETRGPEDKRPKHAWGGYSQDFDDAERVYTHDDIQKFPSGNWGVVDVEDAPHASRALLVFDLDVHKAPAEFNPDDVTIPTGSGPGETLVVRSQSGGLHVYFMVTNAEASELNESDFRMTEDLGWDIDIRGSAVGAHVVAPADIPGVETPYEVVNDAPISAVTDPADAAERIQYKGEPLLEFDPASRGVGDFDFDRDTEPPEDFPTCYHRGLELRAANPDDHPNTHKVNVYTALCGLFAGYDVETVVEHFVDDFPPGNPDRDTTEYQVRHLAEKIDRGTYSPPSITSLRDYGILGEDETCDCSIEFHGGEDADAGLPPEDVWSWWAEKRQAGELEETSIIPGSALRHIADDKGFYNFEALPEDADAALPAKAHNKALAWVKNDWWDPEDEKDAEATARQYQSRDPDAVLTWEDVRYIYEGTKDHGRLAAVTLLRNEYEFLTPQDTETLHVYDDDLGIFDQSAKFVVGKALDENLGRFYSQHEKREIMGRLREETVERAELEARGFDTNLICVENGVLDVWEHELREHNPKYKFTTSLPVTYDPEAVPERTLRFLRDITKRNADVRALLEVLGHTLLTEYDANWKHLFLVLFGEGSNGKSTWFDVVRAFLNGPDKESRNVESLSLQQLTENRFAASSLLGTWANIGADLPQKKIDDLGKLKDLTGGGETWVEQKGKEGFNFQNRATMMFGANRPPVLGERSTAVKRRLVPVHLPYDYTSNPDPDDPYQKKAEDGIVDEMTTDEELSGLLNAALFALDRLSEQKDVSLPESREERLELYERHSDHIKAFRVDCLTYAEGEHLSKDDVYNAYTNFCNQNDYTKVADSTFWRQLRQTTLNVTEKRLAEQPDGSRPRVIDGVTFKEDGLEYAPESYTPPSQDSDDVGEAEDGAPPDHPDPVPVGEIAPSRQDVASTIGTVEFQKQDGRNTRNDDAPAWTATLNDDTGEAELVAWDEENIPAFYDDYGLFDADALYVKGAETGEYDDRTQLVITDRTVVERAQVGAGETSVAETDDEQNQLDASEAEDETPEAEADGGQAADDGDDDGGVPADADGLLADARRLREVLEQHGTMERMSLIVTAADDHGLMTPDRAEEALEKATSEGLIMETDRGLEPT